MAGGAWWCVPHTAKCFALAIAFNPHLMLRSQYSHFKNRGKQDLGVNNLSKVTQIVNAGDRT